jgi:hypothetical protein
MGDRGWGMGDGGWGFTSNYGNITWNILILRSKTSYPIPPTPNPFFNSNYKNNTWNPLILRRKNPSPIPHTLNPIPLFQSLLISSYIIYTDLKRIADERKTGLNVAAIR